MKYTHEQLQAIELSSNNLLVSASAGSGKTTVLIERIFYKIKNFGWNVDDFLVVTYTEAAANELKQRLRIKLTQELIKDPSNNHLRKQLPKIGSSQISTFHAFCNQVIRKFFYLIDFDAIYSIADEIEVSMISQDILQSLFEECFEKQDEKFLLLVERFSQKLSDEHFQKLLNDLYKKMSAVPYKEQFKKSALAAYEDINDIVDWQNYNEIKETIKLKLTEAESYFTKAYNLATFYNHAYINQYEEDIKFVNTLFSLLDGDFDKLKQFARSIEFSSFKYRCAEIDPSSKEAIKNFRDKGKTLIIKIKDEYFSYQNKSQVKFIRENKKIIEALFYFLDLFEKRFKEAKHDRGIVDFNDLEVMALKLLSDFEETSSFYKNTFKEILIDEFQDTNSMQETIVKLITKGNNLFMVGDVKQSIYRFRNAEPEIFQRYYKEFQHEEGGKLVNLNANYRSRKEILDFINFLFYQLMDEDGFEITYDEAASLQYGQKDYLNKPLDYQFIHLELIDKTNYQENNEDKFEKQVVEAHTVAKLIKELVENKTLIYDFHRQDLRPVQYKDIVILSRTTKNQETYNDVFKKYDIPLLASELNGYFNSIEVLTVTSILRVIDNPLQDIPIVATLRSPIFRIDEKELIEIKINSNEDYFYLKIQDYMNKGENDFLKDKLEYFLDTIDKWREGAKTDSITELLFKIYHETNYYDFVLGQIGGRQRQANLDLLYDRAKSYEELISNSLFKFIQLINFFDDKEKDLPQARTLSDNEDLVRFMTIHKSKGLEFPIVFVVDLNKKYNTQDESAPILWDKELGIAFSYFDPINRVKYDTFSQSLIVNKMRKKLLAEEMRLLYVALTRAKEHLYLVGTVEKLDKEYEKLIDITKIEEILLPKEERLKINFMDLILPALSRHPDFGKKLGEKISPTFLTNMSNIPAIDINIIDCFDNISDLYQVNDSYEVDFSKYMTEISQRLNYTYPYMEKTNHFVKQTIADIKRAQIVSEYQFNRVSLSLRKPKFIDSINATSRGTSIHQLMQHVDYTKNYDISSLAELREKLIDKEILSSEHANLIDLDKIADFFDQDIVRSFSKAEKINKEMPFTTLLSSKLVYPELKDEVEIMLQGVVDLFIEFKDYCFLIDFKSDRLENTQEDINRIKKQYSLQLNIYKEAMRKIYHNKQIIGYLYLFEINQFIEI